MLYHFLVPLADEYALFGIFRYITFRAAGGMATALLLSFVFGPIIIRWLQGLQIGQVVRDEGPESHLAKAGTPTMGGLLIIVSTVVATVLWAEIANAYVLLCMGVLVATAALGFLDDYLKVVRKRTEGLVARYKLIGQGTIGLALGSFLLFSDISPVPATWTSVPFFSGYHFEIWRPLLIPWVMLVVTGTSNAVNLTDGLDGLAAGLSTIAVSTFGIFAYLIGRVDTSAYLDLFYLPGTGELAIFCVALAGASLGFLWYNAHPAEVFMGDTGSLALGAAIGAIALLIKAEFLLLIVGGVFVMESLAVIVQVAYFKYTVRRYGRGARIFRMTPLHHHFEQVGWAESRVIIRFWILGILFALLGFATLRIR